MTKQKYDELPCDGVMEDRIVDVANECCRPGKWEDIWSVVVSPYALVSNDEWADFESSQIWLLRLGVCRSWLHFFSEKIPKDRL